MATTAHTPSGRIVVVGGANTDILGVSDAALIARDSNPGHVTVSSGGVGRNIAENLARLGVDVELVTAFGGDSQARLLAEECRNVGIGISSSLVVDDVPGSRYVALMDGDHDMALAINDMRALDRLTPEVLVGCFELFSSADLVVIDANPPVESLEWIASNVSAPLLLDPVSTVKAPKARGILSKLHTFKGNVAEAAALAAVHPLDTQGDLDAEVIASELLSLGVGNVYITQGERGVFAHDGDEASVCLPQSPTVADATGAGDAFAAGIAYSILAGRETADACVFATEMAARALESETTVSEKVNLESILTTLREIEG